MRFISSAAKAFGLFIILLTSPAVAGDRLTGADLHIMVRERLAAEGLSAAPVVNPKRLFPSCLGDVEINPLYGSWKTVMVSCPDAGGWKIALRSKLRNTDTGTKTASTAAETTRITLKPRPRADDSTKMIEVAALIRPLKRDEVIMAEDVIMIEVKKANAIGMFLRADDIVGRKVRRNISALRPVHTRHLFMNWMVEAGQEVNIEVQVAGIAVSMLGFAEENGQYQDWIKVRNARSGKIVNGQIAGPKKITISANKF